MARTIHRNGDKYREWCSVDGYVTPLLTLAEMERHLIRCHATPADALARIDGAVIIGATNGEKK